MGYGQEYQDRGMVKWRGFYLSEHTEAIDGERTIERSKPTQKFQMDVNEIADTLNQAALKNKSVTIQIEARDRDGSYFTDIVGHIEEHDELGIYVGGTKVGYDEIRNIEIITKVKWSSTNDIL